MLADPTCQAWFDQGCCAEEKACAANCQQVTKCIDACPTPRTDACVHACAQSVTPEGLMQLNAIADCSKMLAPPPNNTICDWP